MKRIQGNWKLEFDENRGPIDEQTFNKLKSCSESSNELVKYYSGTVKYLKKFDIYDTKITTQKKNAVSQFYLDMGKVEVMARVILNGMDCGTVWKPPYHVDISEALKQGTNKLEIEVVNTWANRMSGDEQLPSDAEWKDRETLVDWPEWVKNGDKSPTGNYTFTTTRHHQKDSPLMLSGLPGPVKIISKK